MSEQKKTEKNRKGGKIVFAGCAVIIVMLLAVIVYLLSSRQGQKEEEPVNRNVVINKDNVEVKHGTSTVDLCRLERGLRQRL